MSAPTKCALQADQHTALSHLNPALVLLDTDCYSYFSNENIETRATQLEKGTERIHSQDARLRVQCSLHGASPGRMHTFSNLLLNMHPDPQLC